MNIAQHGKRSGNAAGGRIGQNRNIRNTFFLHLINRRRGTGHLHQGQNALLHAGAAGGSDNNQRVIIAGRNFSRFNYSLADGHSHRAAHKREIHCGDDAGNAADVALGNTDGIIAFG